MREFLGTVGFCRLWIPGFAEMAAPLYPLTKQSTPFTWRKDQQDAFEEIKDALLSAPALGFFNGTKPFEPFVDEWQWIAKGALTQRLGTWRTPIAYLSKKLDNVAASWPPCLRMVAAIATLIRYLNKLTMGQPLVVISPHAVETRVYQSPNYWISNARITHYKSLLLDLEWVRFGPAISPATLLPDPQEKTLNNCQ